MRSRFATSVAAAVTIAVVSPLLFALPVLAQQSVAGRHASTGALPAGGSRVPAPPTGEARLTTDVVVVLSGPPLYDLYAAARDAAGRRGAEEVVARATLETWLAAIEARQDVAASHVQSTGATVISRYQAALNGLLVRATAEQQRQIAAMPGVRSIVVAPEVTIELDRSVPHIGAKQVKEELGFDGQGGVIAIIDMGVDYTHKSLGGPGTTEAYAANDPNIIETGTFPTAKVIGGVDLAGPYYAPNCPVPLPTGGNCTTTPDPDDDPLDQYATNGSAGQGHGSHVAGIAAGSGSTTPSGGAATPPGVAPGAKIVGVKIFGNPTGIANFQPTTRLTYDGLDWIAKHNLGVEVPGVPATDAQGNRIKINALNMSVGGAWGGGMQLYNEVIGRIVDSGVAAAFSAGNSGNVPYVLSSPGAADMAVSVANSYPGGETGVMFTAVWDGGEVSVVPFLANEILAPQFENLPPMTNVPMAWYGLACNDTTTGRPVPPVQDVRDKVALIQRGTCNFSEKFDSAASYGAKAVVIFSDDRAPTNMTGTCWPKWPCSSVPGVMIQKADGEAIKTELEAGVPVLATFEVYERPELTNTINAGSSRGPTRFTGGLKPQVTAPGTNILSVYAGTGYGAWSMSGTSMASPHIAGVSALLWQRNTQQKLGLTAAEISALGMNYASNVIYTESGPMGPLAITTRQGAGLVDALASVKGNTIVRSDSGIAELGFGSVFAGKVPTMQSRHLTIRNIGPEPKTYKMSATFQYPENDRKGILFAFDPATVTVAAGATSTVRVDMLADPVSMNEWSLPGENRASAMTDAAAFGAAEITGHVHVTEVDASGAAVSGGDAPHVPFNTLPHRATCVSAGTTGPIDVRGGPVVLSFTNACSQTGGQATYLRLGRDPAEEDYPGKVDVLDVGARWFSTGITDTTHPTVTLQALEFAIRTTGERRIPIDTQMRVYFDLDRDGKWDKVGWNVRLSSNQWGTLLGEMIPGTLEPNQATAVRSDGSFFTFFQPFDISENTSVLRFMPNHPEFGLDLDLEKGGALFNFGVSVWDATGDYELTSSYLGYDNAPDNLASGLNPGPNDGVAYVFDQKVVDCLRLTTSDGTPVPGFPETIAVAPGTTVPITVTGCTTFGDVLEKTPHALMVHSPYNERSSELVVLPFGKSAIYLPITMKQHDVRPEPQPTTETPVATEPAPTAAP